MLHAAAGKAIIRRSMLMWQAMAASDPPDDEIASHVHTAPPPSAQAITGRESEAGATARRGPGERARQPRYPSTSAIRGLRERCSSAARIQSDPCSSNSPSGRSLLGWGGRSWSGAQVVRSALL